MSIARHDAADADRLVIGRFARRAGLSIGALRHYDEVGLLRPAWVDPDTGYRYYGPDQLTTATLIVRLRDLEVPLESIRAYLAADDPEARRRILADHRRAVEARTLRLQRILHVVGQLAAGPDADPSAAPTGGGAAIDQEDPPVTTATPDTADDLDPATHRALGTALFNRTWTLLERADRSAAETDEMIHAAHASRFHWSRAQDVTPANLGRGEWQCARVYATLGRGEPALWHARRCLAYAEAGGPGVEDWDLAAAYEAMARAAAVAGDPVAATAWKARAVAALDDIADPDEREIIDGDIATLPV